MRDTLKLGVRLFILSLVAALLLGITNEITSSVIAQKELEAAKQARQAAFEGSEIVMLEQEEWPADKFPEARDVAKAVINNETAGYVVSIAASGYGGEISLMVGVTVDGKIKKIIVGTNSETPGLGKNAEKPEFAAQFEGKAFPLSVVKGSTAKESEIQALSGATITTKAITNAVNKACELAGELGGAK